MNGSKGVLLKQAKSFTLILVIFYTVYSVMMTLASAFAIAAGSVDWLGAGMTAEEANELSGIMVSTGAYITYFLTIVYIVLTVFLYISNSKFKKGETVSKIPYFFVAAVQIYSTISEMLSAPFSMWGLIVNMIIGTLAVMVIVILFKLESEIAYN